MRLRSWNCTVCGYAMLVALALSLSGCSGGVTGFWSMLVFAVLALIACTSSDEEEPEDALAAGAGRGGRGAAAGGNGSGGMRAGTAGIAPVAGSQGGEGGEGGQTLWVPEACCIEGKTSVCWCPATETCNFGFDVDFRADGTCCSETAGEPFSCSAGGAGSGGAGGGGAGGGGAGAGGADAGGAGAGGEGYYGTCCVEGLTSTCYCLPGEVCNFGFEVTFCADGTCVYAPAFPLQPREPTAEELCGCGAGGTAGAGGAGGALSCVR